MKTLYRETNGPLKPSIFMQTYMENFLQYTLWAIHIINGEKEDQQEKEKKKEMTIHCNQARQAGFEELYSHPSNHSYSQSGHYFLWFTTEEYRLKCFT